MKMKLKDKLKLNLATRLLEDILTITHQIYITDLDINMTFEDYCKMVKAKSVEVKGVK